MDPSIIRDQTLINSLQTNDELLIWSPTANNFQRIQAQNANIVPVGSTLFATVSSTVDGSEKITNIVSSLDSNKYLLCNGSSISRTTYSRLFSKIGIMFGAGNGSTTFNIPHGYSTEQSYIKCDPIPGSNATSFGTLTKLNDGRVFMFGGGAASWSGTVHQLGIFGAVSGNNVTWTLAAQGGTVPTARYVHAACCLPDGRLFLAAGTSSGGTNLSTTYLGTVTGNTIIWVQSTNLPVASYGPNIFLTTDGRICIGGGSQANMYFGTVSGNSITWVAGTSLPNVGVGYSGKLIPLLEPDTFLFYYTNYNTSSYEGNYLTKGVISGNTITYTDLTYSGRRLNWPWDYASSPPRYNSYGGPFVALPNNTIITFGHANYDSGTSTPFNNRSYFLTLTESNNVFLRPGSIYPGTAMAPYAVMLDDGRLLCCGGFNRYNSSPYAERSTYLCTINNFAHIAI